MRHRAVVLALVLVVAAVAPTAGLAAAQTEDGTSTAQESCTFPYSATDATGANVTLEEDPERIVTLNPSAAQTMWEIGAREEVVGVSQYASYLEGADEKANVSGANGPSVEKVLDADPDLVLVPNSTYGLAKDRVEQIRDQGIPVYVFGTGTSLEFVANKTETIGRLTGNCEAGQRTADDIRESVRLMQEALADEEKPVGLNVFYGYTSGNNTFIGDVMTTAGLRNGAAEAGVSGFAQLNDETVVQMDPAWIVAPEGSPIPSNEAYNSTTAIQKGNVVRVDENNLQQPAPRSVDAAETIMQAVHPEAYEEYQSMKQQANQTETTAATETADTTAQTTATATTEETGTGAPGFGVVASVVALLGASLLARRR
ncbi:PGF-CTERM-anchored ABC transporter substrate-binding protein [Halopelagius longus]|uniref:Iron complex transport system substrate-binding protein n=1 Tax=Halopelagius longus TaxID=1236180 RepID=A0A1H1C2Q9_9EURY|nr:PGF-CTERM-anchored ABC transporter substrate-binding protein [Halopelagius longus]RDI71042.1 PGF-CTERM sorting domain-containing protein [Halopelagius longus]SDQ58523.1 iron complex transport system substrate-binding protein [Halopelagius longus]